MTVTTNTDGLACMGCGAGDLVPVLNLGVLLVNRELRVTDNVDEENVRYFQLDLFLNFGGHLDSHGNARRNDSLK